MGTKGIHEGYPYDRQGFADRQRLPSNMNEGSISPFSPERDVASAVIVEIALVLPIALYGLASGQFFMLQALLAFDLEVGAPTQENNHKYDNQHERQNFVDGRQKRA